MEAASENSSSPSLVRGFLTSMAWELVRNAVSEHSLGLPNQNLHFNNTPDDMSACPCLRNAGLGLSQWQS